MKRIILSLALAALLVSPGLSAAETWQIDPSHSGVTFKVRHLFSKVPGAFNEFSGTIEYDPASPEKASVNATIQVASVDTKNDNRDEHLRSPDFFDAANHPVITFQSTTVKKSGDLLEVSGDLTMHGVTKAVVLEVEFLGAGPHPMVEGGTVAGFTASTKVNRKDFGISWNKVMDSGGALLGEDIEIALEIEAVHKP